MAEVSRLWSDMPGSGKDEYAKRAKDAHDKYPKKVQKFKESLSGENLEVFNAWLDSKKPKKASTKAKAKVNKSQVKEIASRPSKTAAEKRSKIKKIDSDDDSEDSSDEEEEDETIVALQATPRNVGSPTKTPATKAKPTKDSSSSPSSSSESEEDSDSD
jgi:hypothetical protein